MGFFDNWNFDGLKFFSKIKSDPRSKISNPCLEFLSVVQYLKNNAIQRNVTIAEIGIGYGATALPVLQMLGKDDVYYCFDFAESLQAFADDLQTRDFGLKCQIVLASNSTADWDSYNWNLSNMIFRMRERHETGIFDAVYLDGAHTLFHDGLAVCLLKELIKEDGFLVLDDVFWKVAGRPRMEKNWNGKMTQEQMSDYQVFRVQELFLSNDPNFEKLSDDKSYRGIFKKRSR